MHKRPFCEHHLLQLLPAYENQPLPLDLFVSGYFRAHRALGAKDRKVIAEAVYTIIRWRSLIDALCGLSATWERRVECYADFDPVNYRDRVDIPLHIRYSCPEDLFGLLVEQYGEEQAKQLCLVANTPAPTTVRVNTLKITRDELLNRWSALYPVRPCVHSPVGIIFEQRANLFSLPEFTAGLFEMQDEASQLVADLVDVKPGQQVLDFCSGSGGKTLAFAPKMQQKGQVFLHDIRPRILVEARKRLRRAGIQNAQVVEPDATHLRKLKKRMDWVLVDAPCTGTGTLRRNPDMKWRFTASELRSLLGDQRVIFEQGLSYLKPDGYIVYATCSLLRQENQQQLEHFVCTYGLKLVGEPFCSLPTEGGMDGFFGAVLKRA